MRDQSSLYFHILSVCTVPENALTKQNISECTFIFACIHAGKSGTGVRISSITAVRHAPVLILSHVAAPTLGICWSTRVAMSLRIPPPIQVHFGATSPALQRQHSAGKVLPWRCFSFGYARDCIYASTRRLLALFSGGCLEEISLESNWVPELLLA